MNQFGYFINLNPKGPLGNNPKLAKYWSDIGFDLKTVNAARVLSDEGLVEMQYYPNFEDTNTTLSIKLLPIYLPRERKVILALPAENPQYNSRPEMYEVYMILNTDETRTNNRFQYVAIKIANIKWSDINAN